MAIYIQDRFIITKDGQTLQDAIVLPKEDYDKLTSQEIETQKQQRFNNWQEAIKNPPKQVELTKEEQLAQVDKDLFTLEEQKQVLTTQKADIQSSLGITPKEVTLADKPV